MQGNFYHGQGGGGYYLLSCIENDKLIILVGKVLH